MLASLLIGLLCDLPCSAAGLRLQTDRQTRQKDHATRSVTIGRIYTAFHENVAVNLCQQLYQILTDFENSFIVRLCDKFAVKSSLKIPQHLKRVATLLCEILMSENKRQFQTGTVNHVLWLTINHKALQLGIWGTVAFSMNIYCKYTAESACKS